MVDDKETKSRYRADHLYVYVPYTKEDYSDDKPAQHFGSILLEKGYKGFAFAETPHPQDVEKRAKKFIKLPDNVEFRPISFDSINEKYYPQIIGPESKEFGTLTKPRQFNLMLDTYPGVIRDEANKAYLRPETAQGIFLNFKNVVDSSRVRVPFGIAQVGKAFRNEVTPRNFIYRSREFEQMEMEWFCHPSEAKQWRDFWFVERQKFWRAIGLSDANLQLRDHDKDELSHYAKEGLGTADIEYRFPFTAPDFGELEGIAHRVDFDLKAHQETFRRQA